MAQRFDAKRLELAGAAFPIAEDVQPDQAAAFLNTNRLKVVRMARSGILPAHPLGSGKRRQWRFKLSELDKYMQTGVK